MKQALAIEGYVGEMIIASKAVIENPDDEMANRAFKEAQHQLRVALNELHTYEEQLNERLKQRRLEIAERMMIASTSDYSSKWDTHTVQQRIQYIYAHVDALLGIAPTKGII